MQLIFARDTRIALGELGDPAPAGVRVRPSDPPDPPVARLVATLASIYAAPAGNGAAARPWIRANMVTSADGAASAAGLSAGLSSPADRLLFSILRSLADVILVGAGTARAENYGPAKANAIWPQLRTGRAPTPPIAVLTRSLNLDPESPLLHPSPDQPRTIVLTCEAAPQDRRAAIARNADLVVAGEKDVDLPAALAALSARGHHHILTEGGPTLLGQLRTAGLLDELCLTIGPLLEGGAAPRIIGAPAAAAPVQVSHLTLLSAIEDAGTLLCRYQLRD